MNGGVEVFPDEGVVLHVLDIVLLRHVAGGQVADAVHGHDADILDGSEEILKKEYEVNFNLSTSIILP